MDSISNIYSLSKNLTTMKQMVSSEIILLDENNIDSQITDSPSNVILFDFQKSKKDNQLFNKINNQISKSNLVCIDDELDSNDKYFLLNNGIKYLSGKKFTEISSKEFSDWIQHDEFKVLMIEDNIIDALRYEELFETTGFKVKTILTNIEILESLKFYQPDLLLVNVNLNNIAGDELVKLIKKVPENLSLPIVFLTEEISKETKNNIIKVGASDILIKPVENEVIISAIINCIQVNLFHKLEIETTKTVPQYTYFKVKNPEKKYLTRFIFENSNNSEASIIWLSIANHDSIQKKIGLSGFKNLCVELLDKLPNFNVNYCSKKIISEGVFAFTSKNLLRNDAKNWVEKIQSWLKTNHFSKPNKEFKISVKAIILSEIPKKSNIELLFYEAERLLIDKKENPNILFLSEGEDQKHYYLIKTKLENAIRENNFKWLYQAIIATEDESREIFQLLLRVNTSTGKELKTNDYIKVANQTGLLKILDRYTLKHAIYMINKGEQSNIKRHVLVNQLIADYESASYRKKILSYIQGLKLPKDRLVFQFRQDLLEEHTSLLHEFGQELRDVNITICLSEFDATPTAWSIAKAFNVQWLRVKPFDLDSNTMHKEKPEYIGNIIKKAQSLDYKIMVPNVDSAGLIANIWNLHADFIQGNFIQKPVSNIKLIEN
jgi:EAL domain-containing protein (putative c-di-GMP-specific phosphodiesterase class I)/CheY-like chemotaxis protein